LSNEKLSLDKLSVDAVFERIAELYGAPSDAAIGRKLGGLSNQAVYTYRKRNSIPYGHIIENCPAADWPYIFLGSALAVALPLQEAIRAVEAAGLAVVSRSLLRDSLAPVIPQERPDDAGQEKED
jgi:hypothetical protein